MAYIIAIIWAITGKNYKDFKEDIIRPVLKPLQKIFIKHEKKADIRIIPTDNASHG